MDKEIWKDIESYEGLYQVSNLGRVKSLNYLNTKKQRILCQSRDKKGYCVISLYKRKKLNSFKVHRLVANAFIPNPKNKPQVNHKNGDKTDNCVKNLEWVSSAENIKHAYATKLRQAPKGQKSPRAKLTKKQVQIIRGEYIPYDRNLGAYALARKYCISPSAIRSIIQNKTYKEI